MPEVLPPAPPRSLSASTPVDYFLGSAAVGAALSNPPTPGSGVWGGPGKLTGGSGALGSFGTSTGGRGLGFPRGQIAQGGCSNLCNCRSKWHGGTGRLRESTLRGPGRSPTTLSESETGLRRSREVSNGAFGAQNSPPSRLQNRLRSIPRHFSTATFPWGRRQWAQPSRMCLFVCHGPAPRPWP